MQLREFKAELVPRIGRLGITPKRRVLNDILAGEWVSSIKSMGVEFSGYRAYTPGDDSKLIDWKASLRARKLLVRELEVEKSHNIYFLVDVSDSMLFASTEKLKCEYAAEVISSITFAVLRTGDNVGLGLFTDKLIAKVPPQIGKAQYYRINKILSTPAFYGGNFDLGRAIKYSISFLNMRCTFIIVSDFLKFRDEWINFLELLSQSYNLMGIMVVDPRDEELPEDAGQILIEDPYTHKKLQIDTIDYSYFYAAKAKQNEQKMRQIFERVGAPFLKLRTDEDYFEPMIAFFRRKQKIWA
jgi:uncharacterized protein (DUF58 family)